MCPGLVTVGRHAHFTPERKYEHTHVSVDRVEEPGDVKNMSILMFIYET